MSERTATGGVRRVWRVLGVDPPAEGRNGPGGDPSVAGSSFGAWRARLKALALAVHPRIWKVATGLVWLALVWATGEFSLSVVLFLLLVPFLILAFGVRGSSATVTAATVSTLFLALLVLMYRLSTSGSGGEQAGAILVDFPLAGSAIMTGMAMSSRGDDSRRPDPRPPAEWDPWTHSWDRWDGW